MLEELREFDFHEFYLIYPRSVVLVGVGGERPNLMPVVWHTPLSFKPPLYGVSVSPKRHTYGLLLKERHFSVNFLPFDKAELFEKTGFSSGREVDKFAQFGIGYRAGALGAPVLSDAYAALVCRLVDELKTGDHSLFVGEVVAVYRAPGSWEPYADAEVLSEGVKPTLYLGKGIYDTLSGARLKLR